jgi:internalin A
MPIASEMRTKARAYRCIAAFFSVSAFLLVSCSTEDTFEGSSGGWSDLFPDSALESAVRAHIGKPEGPIYISDIDTITSLSSVGLNGLDPGIQDLTGIQYVSALVTLDFYMNPRIRDISPLTHLAQLKSLNLGCCDVPGEFESVVPISHLSGLTNLCLCNRGIRDLSMLGNLAELEVLDAGINHITDLSPLSALTNLHSLVLDENQISDLSPVASLHELTYLRAGENQIRDLTPLSELTHLHKLDLGLNGRLCPNATDAASPKIPPLQVSALDSIGRGNLIEDIGPLSGLTELTELILNENFISDLSPLTNLTELTLVWLTGNQISDISPLQGLTNLRDVWLGDNQITNILPLVNNPGIGNGDCVWLVHEPLDSVSIYVYIPKLEARGVLVLF